MNLKATKEYKAILSFYGERTAKRNGVLLMNHINEGLQILTAIGASDASKRGYCLHPLFQDDETLAKHRDLEFDSYIIMLAMEYRNIANAYLSRRIIESVDDIKLSPLQDVNDMLIADKVQNYKDFMKYHRGSHERSNELERYFLTWFIRLQLDVNEVYNLISLVEEKNGY